MVGDTTLASSQREAVDRLIAPRIHRGLKVWAGGQWAFLAYAEDAGAKALANTPPLPDPGDTIVVSRLDYYGMLDRLPIRRELLHTRTDRRCGVFVLNRRWAPGFIPSASGTCRSPSGAGKSTPTTFTGYCLDILMNCYGPTTCFVKSRSDWILSILAQ